MQQCWTSCEPELSLPTPTRHRLSPCEHCLEPSPSVTSTTIGSFGSNISQSLPVPCSPLTPTLLNDQQRQHHQSHSSGYESPHGNGLSPNTNSWTLGVGAFSSCQSSCSDDVFAEQEGLLFDECSTTENDDDQTEAGSNDDDFEVLSFEAPVESHLYIKEFEHTTSLGQNNVCNCCKTPLGSLSIGLSERRCHYYGTLYCDQCHFMDTDYIPAKIIQSLDIRRYPVCRRAKSILESHFYQPIFDIQNDNPDLYLLSPRLTRIKLLRIQLHHLFAYISTCAQLEKQNTSENVSSSSSSIENIFKLLYARDHLYQSIHSYSVNDLVALPKIQYFLIKTIELAKIHIQQCVLCRNKGFICEICKKRTEILYPFDDPTTIGQCHICSNIYHRQCWNHIDQDCPRCYRLRQRKREQLHSNKNE